MPIYEYRCESCSHQMEKLQRMSDDKLVDCPECGQPALKRLVSAVAFRLKGSGWYETDFKQDNKRNLAESSNEDKADKKSADGNGEKPAKVASETTTSKKDAKVPTTSAGKSAGKPAAKESRHA